jgi:CHAD domain-containing protein
VKTLELDPPRLQQPAAAVAAEQLRLQFETVLIAALPLLGPSSAAAGDALHDFRVALRRLRSTLRAWKPAVGDTVTPKQRRRLKKLSRSAGSVRDLELRIGQLQQLRQEATPEAAAALGTLADQLSHELHDRQHRFRRRLRRRLPRLAGKLQRRLARPEALPQSTSPSAAAAVLRAQVENHWRRLDEAAKAVSGSAEVAAPHRARIAAKRLRYLLEPLQDWLSCSDRAVHRLTRLQDTLGMLHDTQLLQQTLERCAATMPVLASLQPAVEQAIGQAYDAAARQLPGVRRRPLANSIDATIEHLGRLA